MKTAFYTGNGDDGAVRVNKQQFTKSDTVFMLLGTLDECCSWLGLAKTEAIKKKSTKEIETHLIQIQEYLFIAQAEVATISFGYGTYSDGNRKFPYIKSEHISACENIILDLDAKLPELRNFILPGGSVLSAQCDIARTIARKAERYAVSATNTYKYSQEFLAFLNRLSSVLFVLGRYANFVQGIAEQNPSY